MLRVCFNCYDSYTTDSVYQWDVNHTLEITGLTTRQAPTIHFCNKKSTIALVVQSEMSDEGIITAPIPNALLMDPYNIIAYVHIYDDNNSKTIETINIPLVKRLKPDEYQFEENLEIRTFERLEVDIADFKDYIIQELNSFTETTNQNYADFTQTTNKKHAQLVASMEGYVEKCEATLEELKNTVVTVDGGYADSTY